MVCGLVLLGFEVIGWMGERCCLLFSVCELLVLCGRCILCRWLWWWPARSVNAYWRGRRSCQGSSGEFVGVKVGV